MICIHEIILSRTWEYVDFLRTWEDVDLVSNVILVWVFLQHLHNCQGFSCAFRPFWALNQDSIQEIRFSIVFEITH